MNKCDCLSNTLLFWNNMFCEVKRGFNQSCESDNWCNSLNNSLQCIRTSWITNSLVGVCSCNSSQYYDATQKKCLTVKPFNTINCLTDKECDNLKGLYCNSGTCTCSSNEYFDGISCGKF